MFVGSEVGDCWLRRSLKDSSRAKQLVLQTNQLKLVIKKLKLVGCVAEPVLELVPKSFGDVALAVYLYVIRPPRKSRRTHASPRTGSLHDDHHH